MTIGYAVTLRNQQLDLITTRAGTSAILRIYSGTQPATGGAETTILAELVCNASAFAPAASSAVLTLNAISDDASADATGTASWFRIQSSGATHVLDGTVTATGGGGDMQLSTTSIVAGARISITSATITRNNP